MIKPKTHTRRLMFNLSPEDIRILKTLSDEYGETTSQVIKRALMMCYCAKKLAGNEWIEEENKS